MASVDTDRLLVRAAESFNARDFDAAIASAEQVLKVLPGNHNAMEILENSRQKKTAEPQFEVARQRAMAALDGHRMNEARAALEKMKSLDAEHPAVALLERRLNAPAEPSVTPPSEAGESTNPGFAPAQEPGAGAGGLDDLSLDSLSLDEESAAIVAPPTDFRQPKFGPLAGTRPAPAETHEAPSAAPEPGGPPDLWNSAPEEPESDVLDEAAAASSVFSSQPSESFSPTPRRTRRPPRPSCPPSSNEIETLLAKGDEAAGVGNRQQAIEIWSRIFLIDINNSEAVGRIEKARQEMAEGNKRIAESLRRGREKFEAGDFTAAREAFLEVAASDETDATARSYLDRIEQELSRPSSGLDLSRKGPQGDILAEELAETPDMSEAEEALPPPPSPRPRLPRPSRADRSTSGSRSRWAWRSSWRWPSAATTCCARAEARAPPRRLRAEAPRSSTPPCSSGRARSRRRSPSCDRFRRRTPTTRARRNCSRRCAKRTGDAAAPAGSAEAAPADASKPPAGPPPEAVALSAEGEKALAEKRYIDALKSLNLAASAYQSDPTFAPLVGAASERVAELTPAVKLYNEGEYETAVPILWRIFQAGPVEPGRPLVSPALLLQPGSRPAAERPLSRRRSRASTRSWPSNRTTRTRPDTRSSRSATSRATSI